MVTIDSISRRLTASEEKPTGERLAGVAVILAGDDLQTLLIRRADRAGDPWSGQVAFPGGKMQEGDPSVTDTAVRETKEEVGVDLTRAKFVGRMRQFRTHTGTMLVVPSVFTLPAEVSVNENAAEVASHAWVALEALGRPESKASYYVDAGGERLAFPAYRSGGLVIWGLTQRIISSLLE